MICTAKVMQVYIGNGPPVCDVADEVSGATFKRCPLLMGGGATPDDHVYNGPQPGSRVVIGVYSRGAGTGAIVLGALPSSAIGAQFNKDGVEVDPSTDYPLQVDVKDSAWRKGQAAVVLTSTGIVVIDTTKSSQPVQIQLAGGAALRISQNGEEPTERVLLAGPTRDKLDELVNRVNDVVTALLAVAGAGAASSQAMAAALTAQFTPLGALPVTPTSDSMLASAILLSDHSAGIDGLPDE